MPFSMVTCSIPEVIDVIIYLLKIYFVSIDLIASADMPFAPGDLSFFIPFTALINSFQVIGLCR